MKKIWAAVAAVALALVLFTGCISDDPVSGFVPHHPGNAASSSTASSVPVDSGTPEVERTTVQVAGLKGPTTMGMVKMMKDAEEGAGQHDYVVQMYGTADEIVPKLVSGEVQVAAVPANLASVMYNNTGGKIKVAAINTLGVLYVVETGSTVTSVEDLRGKTIYSTGKGTTPEFVLNYILEQNGLDPATDVTIEYKSESTEIAALLQNAEDAIAVLPQPYVTAVQAQNSKVEIALSLTDEWDKVSKDSGLVTGVLVANAEWLENNGPVFTQLLQDYRNSIAWVQANEADAAGLIAEYEIVANAKIAETALPYCSITYIAGAEMKTMLSGYLQVLYDQLPEAVGGTMPDDAFYYGA